MSRIVTLIGYRGSGKSTVAPIVARRLACPWIDADREIERRSGSTIQKIFETGGEIAFRQLERTLMQQLLNGPPIVLAAGGGAILDPQTRRDMTSAGPVAWLTASATILAQRIAGDASTDHSRPSLTGQSVQDEIATVLAERLSLYREAATFEINTEGQSAGQIADAVLKKLSDVQHPGGSRC